ncbi:FAD-binding protein (plasmid) [Embleya sp. NBC_00888]|uniref:FAD-binding protein n=1 Tax=Embleya sp. NBC_00888 TaxID=2975960 RepID=UPI002F90757E|nr:FAD-binding protein [Embleya sp. NBC_00888]
MTDHRDVVIIGAGAAGLSAGIVMTGAHSTTLVVDGGKPRNPPATRAPGLVCRDSTAPSGFSAIGRSESTGHGSRFDHGRVTATGVITGRLLEPDETTEAVRYECAGGVAR